MEDPEALLASMLAWARSDPRVTAVIQTGSRSRGERVDAWSDLDIEIISPAWRELGADFSWVEQFGSPLLRVSFDEDDDYDGDRDCPSQLVVYAGGRKVDFTVAGDQRIATMTAAGLDVIYARGYAVRYDRNGITTRLPAPRGGLLQPALPTRAEFNAVRDEFWFEATQIPIYIARGDLWVVKYRDNTMKGYLLKALEWLAQTEPGEPVDTWYIGLHMREWLPEATWQRLGDIYGGFSPEESLRALHATAALFRDVTAIVARRLDFPSREETAERVLAYIAAFEKQVAHVGSEEKPGHPERSEGSRLPGLEFP
jgi:aminoglycoside 6-adenylyltransferase